MSAASTSPRVWPVVPDWTNGVSEKLAWSTEVLIASGTGVSQHRSLRLGPTRSLAIEALAHGNGRRLAETLLAAWSGDWWLPIWPDVQWLSGALAAGARGIVCDTTGYDFVVGGRALLFDDTATWEVITVDAIGVGGLTFSTPTMSPHGLGSRLYPLRKARVRDGTQETFSSDELSTRSITFDVIEPNDFPVLDTPTQYLGHIVLDVRPDESDNPTASFSRLAQTVDYGTSEPLVYDLPGFAFRSQQSHWQLQGRAQHTWFRSLLYTLQGQRVPLWVPTFAADFQLAAAITGAALKVDWAGYTQFGLGLANRRDVRIELYDGCVFYRRIIGAAEAATTELLTLDSALDPTPIAVAAVRQISFLSLSTLASDEVEIDHVTDASGAATVTTGWKAVVPDV